MFIIFINLLKLLVCWEAKIVNFTIKVRVHQLYSPIHLEKEMSDSQETVILGLCQGLEQLHSELKTTQYCGMAWYTGCLWSLMREPVLSALTLFSTWSSLKINVNLESTAEYASKCWHIISLCWHRLFPNTNDVDWWHDSQHQSRDSWLCKQNSFITE